MTDPGQASALVRDGMAAITVVVALLVLGGIRRVLPLRPYKTVAASVVTIWLAGTYVIAASGALARFDAQPPPFAVMLVLLLVAGVGVALSPLGRRVAEGTPIAWIIGLQAFRLPLELVMHQAASEGVMPVEMSFSGYNFDIVTGATAIIVGPLVEAGKLDRRVIWAWNVMGSVLLLAIMTVAVLATPMFAAFGPGSLNTWVACQPFVWLPTVLVVTALMSHIVIFRALLSSSRSRTP